MADVSNEMKATLTTEDVHLPIPVTIITGFLGSGKTTLLNNLMAQRKDEQIVLIINEYGDEGIDHELVLEGVEEQIFQMNNGCMCCILREDLVRSFIGILDAVEAGKLAVDRIIIETSGLAEPSPIAQTLVRTPYLSERMVVDSILTLVDTQHFLHQVRHYTETEEQIAYADKLLLTKTDLVPDDKVHLVKEQLRAINPFVMMEAVNPKTARFEEVIGLDLFDRASTGIQGVEADVDRMVAEEQHAHHHASETHSHADHPHNHDHPHDHAHHHSAIEAFSMRIDRPLDERKLMVWLNMIINLYGMDLMRYKGVLTVAGHSRQVVLQGVNMAFNMDFSDREVDATVPSKMVLIGRQLPEALIRELFEETVLQ